MRLFIVACVSLSCAGCATVKVSKVTDETYEDGLRFYPADPYILVSTDKDGNLLTSVISLPNHKAEYVIRTSAGFGTAEMSATLEGGWMLTQLGAKADSKAADAITAITGALGTVAGLRSAMSSLRLEPGLYRLEFDPKTGTVTGLVPVLPRASAQ